MHQSLLRMEIVPFILQFSILIGLTILGDLLLHVFGLVDVGRHLGIPGTLLIIFGLSYSFRKRKVLTIGTPRLFLRIHETCTWLGTLMVLIHAGVHFNTLLPWLATLAMIINVVSGLVGRYLLGRSQRFLALKRKEHLDRGLSRKEVDSRMFFDAVTFELMTRWRTIHLPISMTLATLVLGHVVSILMFWDWR
ncbi:MAG: hypothetical protein HQL76_10060 [Magnetococcales bacterium]|nr:hypothetical protein [Magnetococcales bacterium]